MAGGESVDDVVVLAAARAVGLIASDGLPDVATWLVATGGASPSLEELAGLDLEPFDPRDATDLWEVAVQELGANCLDVGAQLDLMSGLVAQASARGRVTPDDLFRLVDRIFDFAVEGVGFPFVCRPEMMAIHAIGAGWHGASMDARRAEAGTLAAVRVIVARTVELDEPVAEVVLRMAHAA